MNTYPNEVHAHASIQSAHTVGLPNITEDAPQAQALIRACLEVVSVILHARTHHLSGIRQCRRNCLREERCHRGGREETEPVTLTIAVDVTLDLACLGAILCTLIVAVRRILDGRLELLVDSHDDGAVEHTQQCGGETLEKNRQNRME